MVGLDNDGHEVGSVAPAIPFPFEPYEVQRQLMTRIYRTLEAGGIGIFESPTGTGKSLSVICSALQWLKDAEQRDVDDQADVPPTAGSPKDAGAKDDESKAANQQTAPWPGDSGDDGDDADGEAASSAWLDAYAKETAQREREARSKRIRHCRGQLEERLSVMRDEERIASLGRKTSTSHKDALRFRGGRKRPRPKSGGVHAQTKGNGQSASAVDANDDDEFLVAEYDSGAEASCSRGGSDSSEDEEARAPMASRRWTTDDGDEWEDLGLRQILYCSRTHSQTSQFINELQKNKREGAKASKRRVADKVGLFGRRERPSAASVATSRLPNSGSAEVEEGEERNVDDVETDKSGGCPLLAAEGQAEFPFRALSSVRDIEELAELGKREGTCAYYGARKAAALAQLVVMPYAALLSRETRAAMGVRLADSVVIIDEAHNIVEAINSVHSKRLTLSEVSRAHSQLSQYEAKYGSRLKGRNAFYVGNILRLLRSVVRFLKSGERRLQSLRERKTNAATSGSSGQSTKGTPRACGHLSKNGRPATGAFAGSATTKEPRAAVNEAEEDGRTRSEMLEVNDFLFRAGVDNLNLFKLRGYMRKSEISRKVMGFVDRSAVSTSAVSTSEVTVTKETGVDGVRSGEGGADDAGGAFVSKHVSALQTMEGFLDALTNSSRDGRVLVTYGGKVEGQGRGTSREEDQRGRQRPQIDEEPSIKFLMLNPAVHFDEIVQKARAIVLVGGTMQPTGDLMRQLFSSVEPSRLDVFSCGHVIPKENLLPLCLSRGPSGKTFNFTFHRRGTEEQLDELGRLMTNVCKLVPGGVVCFLASYGYLDQVIQRWKLTGALRHLTKLKSIFSEPRSAKDVDAVLRDFSLAARAGAQKRAPAGDGNLGGLLLSVVGAKMSEGINFSDDLARCVVMVGLPYPDKRDPELKQKMAYLDKADPMSRGRAGREYYSSICMRAVNQSIGRSIRHAGDYASILLVDERYQDPQVIRQLPGWIAERVVKPAGFRDCFVALRRFFVGVKDRQPP